MTSFLSFSMRYIEITYYLIMIKYFIFILYIISQRVWAVKNKDLNSPGLGLYGEAEGSVPMQRLGEVLSKDQCLSSSSIHFSFAPPKRAPTRSRPLALEWCIAAPFLFSRVS